MEVVAAKIMRGSLLGTLECLSQSLSLSLSRLPTHVALL